MFNPRRTKTSKSTKGSSVGRAHTGTEQGIYRKGMGSRRANWRYQGHDDPQGSPLSQQTQSAGNMKEGAWLEMPEKGSKTQLRLLTMLRSP